MTTVVPEKPECGVSGLVGVLVLDSRGDLDLVEVESDAASELSVSVAMACLYSRLGALWWRIGGAGGSDPCVGWFSSESENGVATAGSACSAISLGLINCWTSTGATMVPSRFTVHLARLAACSFVRTRAGAAGRSRTIS